MVLKREFNILQHMSNSIFWFPARENEKSVVLYYNLHPNYLSYFDF